MASMGLNLDEQKAIERFKENIVEPSMTNLVVLDFWAEWCGPCKALTPVLEKVTAEYADKGVVLAKVNVDEEKFIAEQFQVRSIPTVYAMFQGQPVADLTNARTESQLKAMLDQLLAQLPVGGDGAPDGPSEADIEQFIAMGNQVLDEGDAERALGVFSQVVEMAPDNAAAQAGYVRALMAADREDEAKAALALLDETLASEPVIQQVKSALELAANRVDDSELAALQDAADADPSNMDAGLAYAEAAMAAGQNDAAAERLLAMIAADREWNDGAARKQLLQLFEAVGLEDPWVVATRSRLSRILFG